MTESPAIQQQIESAWLMMWEDSEASRVVGLFDPQIPASVMLQMIEQFYRCILLTPYEQMLALNGKQDDRLQAGFMYLNDGSAFEHHIVCGRHPRLEAVLASAVKLYADANGQEMISARYARMMVENGERSVDYWEDVVLPIVRLNI